MLRFILMVVLLAVIFKVSQNNPYLGFGIYFGLSVTFMIYSLNSVACDKNLSTINKQMRKIKRKRHAYIVNS